MNSLKTIFALAAITAFNGTASADSNWTVGLAAQHGKGPYYDTQNMIVPVIAYEKDRLSISTFDGLSYQYLNFSKNQQHQEGSLSFFASPRFAPNFGAKAAAERRDVIFTLPV